MNDLLVQDGRRRAAIEGVSPEIDGGRFPAKRIAGDPCRIEADIFADGHDLLSASLLYRKKGDTDWNEIPMSPLVNDRWSAVFTPPIPGRYEFTIVAWVDPFKTWARDLGKRVDAGSDTPVDYQIGAQIIEEAASRATGADAAWLQDAARSLKQPSDALSVMMARYADRSRATQYEKVLEIVVDPVLARFSTWYEFFPRSAKPGGHGTFRDCEELLPYIAGMGFDVMYFPPIHPIGRMYRKGPNNTLTAGPEDVGSPWAIGGDEGGHKAIHPQLGTLADFDHLVEKARSFGIETALDVAFQASPDHPYVKEHEEWFRKRPDGTIQYAENPPKKYQDIYPFDFETTAWREMWEELKSIFDFWISHGVRIFRVDNPHTKALGFWEWCISSIKEERPDVIFLSEAFTRPKVKYRLAKAGFTQSYTYFPWRLGKQEIEQYFTETTRPPVSDFFRGNHWPNTPDILTEFLQTGGRSGFMLRFLLVSTIAANYGIYGPAFELMENRPARPGSEEYLHSEKYQVRSWDLNSDDSLREMISLVNRIRRENAALQNDTTLQFHPVSNDSLLAFSKQSLDGSNLIVVVINLDHQRRQSGMLDLPVDKFALDSTSSYQVHELLTGARYLWNGPRNFVELDPASVPAHIFRIRRRLRTERDFEYFL